MQRKSSTPQRIAPAIETISFILLIKMTYRSTPQRIAPAIETFEKRSMQ